MRYIIRLEPSQRLEDKDNLTKYEILSIVCKRVLGSMKEKIKDFEGHKGMSLVERNLLTHLSIMVYHLVSQASLFHWRMKKNDYNQI